MTATMAKQVSPANGGGEPVVLVVEDDPSVGEVMSQYLRREGYAVEVARDGPLAVRLAARHRPDLVVLDLLLPGMHGLDVLRRLQEEAPIPVIVLSAHGREADLVIGLESGADDYLAKPFSMAELMARINAVLRRSGGAGASRERIVQAGPIEVDLGSRTVRVRNDEVAMTARELDLLLYFLRHPREAIRRTTLLERVWGYSVGGNSTVTVHVRHLREKIELDPSAPVLLTTLWGVGYRFDPPEDDALAERRRTSSGPSSRHDAGAGNGSAPGPDEGEVGESQEQESA